MTLFEYGLIQAGYEQVLNTRWRRTYSLVSGKKKIGIAVFPSGQIEWQEYLVDDLLSRPPEEGPAFESFYKSGKKSSYAFWYEGKMTRPPGTKPAYEAFDGEGSLVHKEYWIDGLQITCLVEEV